MSEVRRTVTWFPNELGGSMLESVVRAEDYDATQSELAALREELAETDKENDHLLERASAAEQRNATLTKVIRDAEYLADQGKVWSGMGWTYTGLHSHGQQKVLDILRAALKPTESGASE